MGDKGKRLTSPSDSKHRDPTPIHFESLPLVDFPLAFAAPATSKHLILITAERLGSNVVLYVSLRPEFSPVETACTARARGSSLTILCYCVVNFNARYVPTLSPSFSHLAGKS